MSKKQVDFTGSVSEGTMRSEDLIPAFMDVLDKYWPERGHLLASIYQRDFSWPAREGHLTVPDPLPDTLCEAATYLVEDLFDALGELAPDGCDFGAHPGDGADYGFWPVEEML